MYQGCEGRENQRSISSSGDITICDRNPSERCNWDGHGSASPRCKKTPDNEDISAQVCNEAKASNRFTRIVQRKDLPWEKDSIARVAHDPEHIPDCNFQATVGRHFLFHEQIPKAANGSGSLRVATKSLWWQHEHFPKVWTSEGLSTCMEIGYQWNINSTTWNHLRMMWAFFRGGGTTI